MSCDDTVSILVSDERSSVNQNGSLLRVLILSEATFMGTVPCWVSLLRGDKSLDFQTVLLNTYEL